MLAGDERVVGGRQPAHQVRSVSRRPPKLPGRLGLLEAIEQDRAVGARAAKVVSPPPRAVVDVGAAIDDEWPAVSVELEAEAAGMAVTAGEHAQIARIEERPAL